MITGQSLANALDGFDPIASMNPPPGGAIQAAVSALPPPEVSAPDISSPHFANNFRAGLF